jgi:hypothetical protein
MLKFQRKTITIEVDGQDVRLKELSEREAQAWHERYHDAKGRVIRKKVVENRAMLAIMSIVDESGNQMYDETHLTEIMEEWPAGVLSRIFNEAARLSGLTDDEDMEKK